MPTHFDLIESYATIAKAKGLSVIHRGPDNVWISEGGERAGNWAIDLSVNIHHDNAEQKEVSARCCVHPNGYQEWLKGDACRQWILRGKFIPSTHYTKVSDYLDTAVALAENFLRQEERHSKKYGNDITIPYGAGKIVTRDGNLGPECYLALSVTIPESHIADTLAFMASITPPMDTFNAKEDVFVMPSPGAGM